MLKKGKLSLFKLQIFALFFLKDLASFSSKKISCNLMVSDIMSCVLPMDWPPPPSCPYWGNGIVVVRNLGGVSSLGQLRMLEQSNTGWVT